MIINLNHHKVEEYKEKFGIKETYSGELVRLADLEFPPEMDAEEPPVYDVADMIVSDEIMEDEYEMRGEDTDSEEEDDTEEGEEVV